MTSTQKAVLIGLMAETPVHVGIGQSVEAVDLPVAREKTTNWPFVPGSGVKGAFRVWAREQAGISDIAALFGKEGTDSGNDGNAGGLMFSDARLLLLPVRALAKAMRLVTSPGLLRRYLRDAARADQPASFQIPPVDSGLQIPPVDSGKCLSEGTVGQYLGLEEREFEVTGPVCDDVVKKLARLTGENEDYLKQRLVILHDDDFAWFARYGLPIMARNKLDDNKRVVRGALWYEESLATDSFLYIVVGQRRNDMLKYLTDKIGAAPYVQMGGNETLGQGWFRMIAGSQEENV